MALGGRAAEKVVSGEITTGAESVIQNLTQVARRMVGRWGTSEAIGPLAIDGRQDGMLLPGAEPVSPHTQRWWTRGETHRRAVLRRQWIETRGLSGGRR